MPKRRKSLEDGQTQLAAPSKALTLRDYQEEAVFKALDAKHCALKLPTGSGKTIIGLGWIQALHYRMGRSPKVLIVVPTQVLIFQVWTPRLKEYGFQNLGEYYALNKDFGEITTTTYASLQLHPEMIDEFDAVILDEVHHFKTHWHEIIQKLLQKEYILGLSATPDDSTEELFPVVVEMQIRELMDSGHLAELETIELSVELTDDEVDLYNEYTGKIMRAIDKYGTNINEWIYGGPIGWAALKANPARSQLLTKAENKIEQLVDLVNDNPTERFIVFTDSAKVLPDIVEDLRSRGISTECFVAKTPKKKRIAMLGKWGTDFRVLMACRVLDEGMDVPDVRLGVLLSGTNKERQSIQRLGRILRPKEGKIAQFYIISAIGTIETGNRGYYQTINNLLM